MTLTVTFLWRLVTVGSLIFISQDFVTVGLASWPTNFFLLYEYVNFSFWKYDKKLESEAYVNNLVIMLTKFHMLRCKFSNQKPLFLVVINELNIYINTIKEITNKKAVKTVYLFDTF